MNPAVSKKRRDLIRGAKLMQAEGQGVYTVELIGPQHVTTLLAAGAADDVGATRTLHMIGQFLKMCAVADPPMLCLLCDSELIPAAPPLILVLMSAHRDDPTTGLMNGLCEECAVKPGVEKAIMDKFRESLFSDFRQLHPPSKLGHA